MAVERETLLAGIALGALMAAFVWYLTGSAYVFAFAGFAAGIVSGGMKRGLLAGVLAGVLGVAFLDIMVVTMLIAMTSFNLGVTLAIINGGNTGIEISGSLALPYLASATFGGIGGIIGGALRRPEKRAAERGKRKAGAKKGKKQPG